MTTAWKLMKELNSLLKERQEGFVIEEGEMSIFKWRVGIYGPPETIYQGSYLPAELRFTDDYPNEPPTMHFLCPMFHPNIYEDGKVCISILQRRGNDEMSGELGWDPRQNVRTVLISVISILSEPNTSSPANTEASDLVRDDYKSYEARVKKLVQESRERAISEGIIVPITLKDYCVEPKHLPVGEALSSNNGENYEEGGEDGHVEALSSNNGENYEEGGEHGHGDVLSSNNGENYGEGAEDGHAEALSSSSGEDINWEDNEEYNNEAWSGTASSSEANDEAEE